MARVVDDNVRGSEGTVDDVGPMQRMYAVDLKNKYMDEASVNGTHNFASIKQRV
jgi:hypothetical protein